MKMFRWAAAAVLVLTSSGVLAQGQDSTPPERDIMVIAEMLPGVYDNREQVYFDQRRKLPDAARHSHARLAISRVQAPAFGERVFFVRETLAADWNKATLLRLYSFTVDNEQGAVRMRISDLGDAATSPFRDVAPKAELFAALKRADTKEEPECDVLWYREAGQFRGVAGADGRCVGKRGGQQVRRELEMLLGAGSLWIRTRSTNDKGERSPGAPGDVHYKFHRAREFQCHADMPGVGGGRAEEFKRYGPFPVIDQGGEVAFRSEEATPRDVRFSIRSVDWQINNEAGAFTRDVLVLYVYEQLQGGKTGPAAYTFTEPSVSRLGINMGWVMVQCYLQSNREARPEF